MQCICQRLRLSNRETDQIAWLVANWGALWNASQLEVARLKRILGHPLSDRLIQMTRAAELAIKNDASSASFCRNYLRDTPPDEINPPVLLNGDDLIANGLHGGPHFKGLLESARDAQLNGEITTQEEALALVNELMRANG